MKVLIIYGHPYPKSFNHAIKDTLVSSLEQRGHEIRVRDLYALNFDPILKADELAGFAQKNYPEDIQIEHNNIVWAEMLFFISPIWWGGLTSIARGYCDRVFSLNFAYEETSSGPRGLLDGKKAFFITTIGAPLDVYEQMGMIASMKQTIGQVLCDFCAILLLGHTFFSVKVSTDDQRQQMLNDVQNIVTDVM